MGGRGTEEGKEGTEGGEIDGSHRDRVVARWEEGDGMARRWDDQKQDKNNERR